MEQVFPVGVPSLSLTPGNSGKEKGSQTGVYKEGVIEKVIAPGKFIVTLEDGIKIEVLGPGMLKKGTKVRIPISSKQIKINEGASNQKIIKSLSEDGFQFSALVPLAFGGKKAKARLEVFVEREPERGRKQASPAAYFVFLIQTELIGEVQWSIHMKGKQLTLQVFSLRVGDEKEKLKGLAHEVEKSLRKKGFLIMAPVMFLTSPFQVPSGFRLNVTG